VARITGMNHHAWLEIDIVSEGMIMVPWICIKKTLIFWRYNWRHLWIKHDVLGRSWEAG
jgi:hypothetical protein